MASLGEKALEALGLVYSSHEYDFRQKGAEAAAKALSLELSAVLKTLVLKHSGGGFLFLLVPGGVSVSMRKMSRALGVKGIEMASERDAERLTAYRVGGIGPFGSRTPLPVFMELQALEHEASILTREAHIPRSR